MKFKKKKKKDNRIWVKFCYFSCGNFLDLLMQHDFFYRLLYPSALSFIQNSCSGNESSILAVTEGCQVRRALYMVSKCCHQLHSSLVNLFYFYFLASCVEFTVVDNMGLEDERKWRLSTTDLWFCWWYLLCCMQFFKR